MGVDDVPAGERDSVSRYGGCYVVREELCLFVFLPCVSFFPLSQNAPTGSRSSSTQGWFTARGLVLVTVPQYGLLHERMPPSFSIRVDCGLLVFEKQFNRCKSKRTF